MLPVVCLLPPGVSYTRMCDLLLQVFVCNAVCLLSCAHGVRSTLRTSKSSLPAIPSRQVVGGYSSTIPPSIPYIPSAELTSLPYRGHFAQPSASHRRERELMSNLVFWLRITGRPAPACDLTAALQQASYNLGAIDPFRCEQACFGLSLGCSTKLMLITTS